MSGMEDAEIERVLREYDVFQAAKAGLLIPCQGKQSLENLNCDMFLREQRILDTYTEFDDRFLT